MGFFLRQAQHLTTGHRHNIGQMRATIRDAAGCGAG